MTRRWRLLLSRVTGRCARRDGLFCADAHMGFPDRWCPACLRAWDRWDEAQS